MERGPESIPPATPSGQGGARSSHVRPADLEVIGGDDDLRKDCQSEEKSYCMNTRLSRTLAAAASAALLIPAAAVAKPDSDKSGKGAGKPVKAEKDRSGKGADKPGQAEKRKNPMRYNIDGTVASIGGAASSDPLAADPSADDVVVNVTGGNSRGRQFAGQSVTFDLSGAVIKVADTNGDGVRNLEDVQQGDTVKVKLRLARDGSATQPFSAERFEVKTDDGEEEVVTP